MISEKNLTEDESGNPTFRVYLSPHFDDVAFSLGGFVGRHPGGVLINLFTRGNFTADGGSARAPDEADIEATRATRSAEDRTFADGGGLEQMDLMLDEPMLRGRRPRGGEGIDDDVAQLQPLATRLAELAGRTTGRRILFSPAAIGDHVNHMATFRYIAQHLPLLEQHYSVVFYEDLPYARHPVARWKHVARAQAALAPRKVRRLAMPVRNVGQKVGFVRGYESQHRRAPISLRRFSPGAPWPLVWHEAVWSFE